MGCDIHTYVEKKIDGVWTALYGESPYDNGKISLEGWLYTDRSYRLFAVLAGVRSYNDGIQPIAPPRGFPDDITKEVRNDFDGEHTPSWFTLSELLAFDWHKPYLNKAYTTQEQADRFLTIGQTPGSYRERLYDDMPCLVEWSSPLIHPEHLFITEALYKLKYLSDGKHDDIRFIFWFDN